MLLLVPESRLLRSEVCHCDLGTVSSCLGLQEWDEEKGSGETGLPRGLCVSGTVFEGLNRDDR